MHNAVCVDQWLRQTGRKEKEGNLLSALGSCGPRRAYFLSYVVNYT